MNTNSDHNLDFENLKKSVLDMISNACQIIELNGSCCESGIYMLYIDHFADNRIIPFYICKTVNFQRRFQDHIKDVKELMEYSYTEYYNKFFLSAVSNNRAFEGKYRPCKIFKYLIDHDCNIDDIKMVVLEKCDTNLLDEREEYYLTTFLPSFFGFNQIATITEQFQYKNNPRKHKAIIDKDLDCFHKYMEYGYSTFNYLHSFSGYRTPEIDRKINFLLLNHLWPSKNELLSNTISSFENYQKIYNEILTKMRNRFAEQVHDIFNAYNFKSKARETEVLSSFINPYHLGVILDNHSISEYLNYYFNRNKKSRECGETIKQLYYSNKEEIIQIVTPAKNAFETYMKNKNNAIKQSEYSIIFPSKQF